MPIYSAPDGEATDRQDDNFWSGHNLGLRSIFGFSLLTRPPVEDALLRVEYSPTDLPSERSYERRWEGGV